MTSPKNDDLMLRLDARHDDLTKRIADLDRRTNAILAQWTANNPNEPKTISRTGEVKKE